MSSANTEAVPPPLSHHDDDDTSRLLLQQQALQSTALELKKQALTCKQQGNVSEALDLLKQAKALDSIQVDSSWEDGNDDDDDDETNQNESLKLLPPLYWKKVALLYKQQGNVERAKKALIRSKQHETQLLLGKKEQDQTQQKHAETTTRTATDDGSTTTDTNTTTQEQAVSQALHEQDQDHESDADEDNMDLLETASSSPDTFTTNEMMDQDMMTEFQQAGMPIPTMAEYDKHILESKKLALHHKQLGDISKATQHLRVAKQLEAVKAALQQLGAGTTTETVNNATDDEDNLDPNAWMGSLNAEENELLRELFDETSDNRQMDNEELLMDDARGGDTLTVEEIESMDDRDLLDFIAMMGRSSLPTVEKLHDRAKQQQQRAVEHKKTNNLDKAKLALLDSKRAKMQADRLEVILTKLDQQDGDDPNIDETNHVSLEDLEKLMNGSNKKAVVKPNTQVVPPPPPQQQQQDPWLSKPSAEIKAEVLRLKNAKQIKEASQLLQILKQVLQKEQEQAEVEKCSQIKDTLRQQLEVCETQLRLWLYYTWFIDPTTGANERKKWVEYSNNCQQAIHSIDTNGSSSVIMTASSESDLQTLQDDVVSMLDQGLQVSHQSNDSKLGLDNELELSVLSVLGIEQNEKFQRALKKDKKARESQRTVAIRIDAKVHLPLRSDDPTHPVLLQFKATMMETKHNDGTKFYCQFDPDNSKQRLKLPNRESKEWKILRRRMESKTVQLSIFLTREQPDRNKGQKGSSWFFGRGNDDKPDNEDTTQENSDVLLGKIAIELSDLLSTTCVVGDFPLIMNGKAIGGFARVSLRSFPAVFDNPPSSIGSTLPTHDVYRNVLGIEFTDRK
ncbi:hypothetical protein IV203_022571 [Nitzschia inconspicua]|uniref:Uncharacterized protein n=1 Tax=Nitzschia inconspicua TaxID=303405 RepID=A0A9K3PEK8_9STRA|nr:hypothetical protein IV203_022571 [Nitzschia inconspicua]